MSKFTLHDKSTATEKSKPLLEDSEKAFGMIPSLHKVMAESPQLLEAYKMTHKLFSETSFNKDELTVVWQTINVENGCHYCVPAHTGIAKMMEVDDKITNALRDKTPLPNDKLEALRNFTLHIIRDKGNVSEDKIEKFLSSGFSRKNILEIILGYSQKVMSNYVNHLAETPVDEPFQKFEWKPK